MKRPLVITAFILSAFAALLLNVKPIFSIVFAALLFGAAVVFICYKNLRQFTVIAVCLLLLSINYYRIHTTRIVKYEDISKTPAHITGVVTDCSYSYENVIMHEVKITDSSIPDIIGRKVMLYNYDFSSNTGMMIDGDVSLTFIDNRKNLYSENVYFKGNVISVNSFSSAPLYSSFIYKLRLNIRNVIFDNLPYNVASTINGITVGDRSYEEESFTKSVKTCGVSHIMVVSGLHLAVVCGSVYKLLKLLRTPHLLTAVITLIVTILFMALCGFTPSILRAGTMYILMLIGIILHRPPDALNSLSIAFIIMVILNPHLLFNVGFLLSVTSTLGIIVLNPLILELIRQKSWKSKILKGVVELATVTISAQIATLPICLYYFGWVSPLAIVVNVLISYAVTLALISAFLGITLFAIPFLQPLSYLSFVCCSFATTYFNKIILFF